MTKDVADEAKATENDFRSRPKEKCCEARKIVITAFGSHGDINPLIAVALRLKAEGFAPVFATTETFREKVESEALAFWPVRPSLDQMLRDTGMTAPQLIRTLMTRDLKFLIETTVTPYLDQTTADLAEVMAGAELVIVSSFNIAGRLAAEKLNIPFVSILLSPMVFYSIDDPPRFIEIQWLPRLKAILGRTSAKFVMAIIRARIGKQLHRVNELRAKMGLPPSDRVELLDGPLRGALIAGLYSPLLAKLPADAPPQAFIAGFPLYDKDGPVVLPSALRSFLKCGSPPIVFTLGTLIAHDPAQFYDESVVAARSLGRRSILLVSPELETEIAAKLAAEDVYVAGYVPHSAIFSRTAAIVHHGGIGTAAQAMRAGKPQLVCPAIGDQVDNAERLTHLGIGKRLDLKRYTAARAAKALKGLIVENGRPAVIAAQLAPRVAGEDGVGALVTKITSLPFLISNQLPRRL
jgi:rhamnosyltransferase subunit B